MSENKNEYGPSPLVPLRKLMLQIIELRDTVALTLKERDEWIVFAAGLPCCNPTYAIGPKEETGWGMSERTRTTTPCGKCRPCEAKTIRGIALESKTDRR
jgi:hypothetical protein